MRFDIVIVGSAARALNQAERFRRFGGETRYLQLRRIAQRPPYAFTGSEYDLQAVGVVDLIAKIIDARALRFIEQEHRRERRNTDMVERYAGKQRDVDVYDCLTAGNDGKPVGAGRRFAVEQRVHHDTRGVGCRPLNPELCERRKFLAHGVRRADCKPPRRQPVGAALVDRPEVGGALKRQEFVPDGA